MEQAKWQVKRLFFRPCRRKYGAVEWSSWSALLEWEVDGSSINIKNHTQKVNMHVFQCCTPTKAKDESVKDELYMELQL